MSVPPFLQRAFAAVRTNLLPGLVLQCAVVLLALGYWFLPPVRDVLERLAACKGRWGFAFSAVAAAVAGAVLPELLRWATLQRGVWRKDNLLRLLTGIPLWAMSGVFVDALYRFQGVLFGSGTDVWTIVSKVAVDQFVYTPIVGVPLALVFYRWGALGYSLPALREWIVEGGLLREFPGAMCAAWAVWIPVVSVVYALPALLQIPVFSFALCFWVLIVSTLGSGATLD